MGWRRKGQDSDWSAYTDRGGPDLLDVWSDPAEAPASPDTLIGPPHTQATSHQDYAQWPTPLTRAPEHAEAGGADGLTCIRLNCPEHGRATGAARCPTCGHGTALLRDYRWPRTS